MTNIELYIPAAIKDTNLMGNFKWKLKLISRLFVRSSISNVYAEKYHELRWSLAPSV